MNDEKALAQINMETGEIAEQPPKTVFGTHDPLGVVKRASEVANVLVPIIEKNAWTKKIGTKKHVYAEGWSTMLSMLGVFPIPEYSRKVEREHGEIAYEAKVILKHVSGTIVGAGEAFASSREGSPWARNEYSIKSMAQTRALGKAARLSFSWLMALAGFAPTPAEEMPEAPVSSGISMPRSKQAEVSPGEASEPNGDEPPEAWVEPFITRAQQKLLFAKARDAGIDEAKIKQALNVFFGLDSTSKLNSKQLDELLGMINKGMIR